MAKPKMQTDYLAAIKKAKLEAPFSLLPAQVPENSGDYKYKLRKSTVATTVRLYQPILEAIRMYSRNNITVLETPYLMIERSKVGTNAKVQKEYLLETVDEDGFTILVSASEDKIRISKINPADVNDREPVLPFAHQSTRQLTTITLALLPAILKIDEDKADADLSFTVAELGPDLEDADTWTDANDIRDLVKEHLYFTDAAYHVLNSLELNFGDATSTSPEEIDASFFQVGNKKVSGAVICENNMIGGWTPRFIESNGAKAQRSTAAITIDVAKQSYSVFSAGRKWTPSEKALIPSFPDNMPVMPEVIEMADAIVNTVNDPEPVKNIMWRSDTGYGKSTGTKQLACILNVPYLVITCHPGMEISEFKSNFVPNTEGAVELDMNSVTVPVTADIDPDADRPPFFAEAMEYVRGLDDEKRNELFQTGKFYSYAMFEDPQDLVVALTGSSVDISVEDLLWLYGDVRSATMREEPLRKKLQQMAATKAPGEKQKDSNKPEFVHVVSQYIRALVNGYIVEIQEASRIRDSGVLVGLNEYNKPGAVIPLLNGGLARRHKDAICIITDNVGYSSCRAIDPSVIRRQDLIIDSDELSKQELVMRVKFNTGCKDNQLIDLAYSYWNTVRTYCQQNTITEGSTSPMELVRFVQALMHNGIDNLERDLNRCVISKATSNIEDQRDIRTACQTARVA